MIQHMVAAPVNHACFHDCVIKPGVTNNLLRYKLRFVIWRSTIGTCPEKTHQGYPPHSSPLCCGNHVPGSVPVNSLESLSAQLAIDSGTVSDGFTPLKGGRQNNGI